MSHSVTVHAKHAEGVPHHHHLSIRKLTAQYVQALRDAGHVVTYDHVHHHAHSAPAETKTDARK